MAIEIDGIEEVRIEWTPKGYSPSGNRQLAVIRNGQLDSFPAAEKYLIEADIEGYIAFLQAIQKAVVAFSRK